MIPEGARLSVAGIAVVVLLAISGALAAYSPKPLETFVFFVFAGVMLASAIAVLVSRDIVRAASWLLGTLGAAAGLYFLLAANYLGAIQLIVYAGGILILIVFGVMLTARNPYVRFDAKPSEIVVAGLIGIVLFGGLTALLTQADWPPLARRVLSASGEVQPNMHTIGHALLTEYLLPFELVSVLLLAVMIGAAYLARPVKNGE